MKYRKKPIEGYKYLGMYPVYVEDLYEGHEPFTIAGIDDVYSTVSQALPAATI